MPCPARALAVVVALTAGAAAARGDEPVRPRLLAPGGLQLGLGAWARASDGVVALAPEAWLGVGPRLTVGLSHGPDDDGLAAPGRGLCLRRCDPRYRGALVAHVGLGDLVGRAAIAIDGLDPAVVAVELGARADWRGGRGWARIEPALRLGLLGRAHDNRERLGAELAAGVVLAPVRLGLRARPRGPADERFFAGLLVPADVELEVAAPGGVGLAARVGSDDVFADGAGHLVGSLMVAWRR